MGTNAACLPLFPGDSFHASLTCLGQPRKTLQASSRLNFCDFFFSDFVYLWLCWVFVAARMLCGEHRYFLVAVCGFLIAVASLIAEHGLQGTQASVVVAHRSSCPVACGIFLDQGWNLCSLHWQVDSSPVDHQDVPTSVILNTPAVRPCCIYF